MHTAYAVSHIGVKRKGSDMLIAWLNPFYCAGKIGPAKEVYFKSARTLCEPARLIYALT